MSNRQLTPTESRALAVESPRALGHISVVTFLDAAQAPEAVTGALLTREVQARLADLPQLRKRLEAVPLGLDRPWWRDDPSFDLGYHLRYIAVPDPDDPASINELVARIHSRPLDRQRPLWELYLISGLADGQVALLSKVHLSVIGAEAGQEVNAGLVSPERELHSVDGGRRYRPRPGPNPMQIWSRAWLNSILDPARTMRRIPRQLATMPGMRAFIHPPLALLNQRAQRSIVVPDAVNRQVPRTSFNRRISNHRRWAPVVLDLDAIGEIRHAHDVSTVDVLTTVITGALRWWLLEHDELPRVPLQALVPLSVTQPGANDGLAGVVVALPTHRHDPVKRLQSLHTEIGAAVRRHQAMPAADIQGIGGGTPLVAMTASRLLDRSPLADRFLPPFNTVVTSVPGPSEPVFALGAPVIGTYPILGITDGVGLHFGAMSTGRELNISLVAARDLVPDLDELAARVPDELEILAEALAASVANDAPEPAPA